MLLFCLYNQMASGKTARAPAMNQPVPAAKTLDEKGLPSGFSHLLQTIIKGVLTHRPLDIYRFTADLLEAELDRRTLNELSLIGDGKI